MTATIQLTQYFSTRSPRVFDECELLMDELLRREEEDDSVRDAAVSADAAQGLVEVEVVADGSDEVDAQQAALSRIRAAVTSIVKVTEDADGPAPQVMREKELSSQLVSC